MVPCFRIDKLGSIHFLGSLPKQNNIIQQPLTSGCLGFKECVCKMKQTDLPSFSCEQLLKWLWDSWMLTSKMLVSFQPRHKVLRIQLRILVQQKELRGAVHFATFQFKSELYMCQDGLPSDRFLVKSPEKWHKYVTSCHENAAGQPLCRLRRDNSRTAANFCTYTSCGSAATAPDSRHHRYKDPFHGPREPKKRTRLSFVLVDAFGIN